MTRLLIRLFVKNHQNTNDPAVRFAYGRMASVTGIVCNLVISLAKILLGIAVSSVAIMADGFNNLSDASASVMSFWGFKLAHRPADAEHPYGHGRYEYLSALLVAVMVAVIGVELLKEGVGKILSPTPVTFHLLSAFILVLSTLVKLWMTFFYRKVAGVIDSGALYAASLDSRNDVITTLAVLVGGVISHVTDVEVDGYVGVAVALFILYSSYGMIRSTLDPMLGAAPSKEFVEKIEAKIKGYPDVLGIHDLLIHDYGPGRQFGSVHIEMAAEGDVLYHHDVIDNIERDCLNDLGLHIIVHYDPIVTSDATTKELRQSLQTIVTELDSQLSIHDLRTAVKAERINMIFDVAAPYSFPMSDAELKALIRQRVAERYPEYTLFITVDRLQSYMPH